MEAVNLAAELNELILKSAEYSAFSAARLALDEFPIYREMVDGFRRRQVEYEADKLSGCHDNGIENALANDYADICLITPCNDFFQAEMAFLELIKAVNAKVWAGVDIGFEEEVN